MEEIQHTGLLLDAQESHQAGNLRTQYQNPDSRVNNISEGDGMVITKGLTRILSPNQRRMEGENRRGLQYIVTKGNRGQSV